MSAQPTPDLPTPEEVVARALHPVDAPADDAVDAETPWEITDRGAAEWAIAKMRQSHQTFAADTASALQAIAALQDEMNRLMEFVDDRRAERDNRLAFFESRLTAYLRDVQAHEIAEGVPETKRTKSLKLAGGTVKSTAGRPSVVIEDEAAFVALHGDDSPFVKVERKPVRKAVADHVKATQGEVPEGASIDPGERTYKVELDGEK